MSGFFPPSALNRYPENFGKASASGDSNTTARMPFSVYAAVEAAEVAANNVTGVVTKHIIASVEKGADKMLGLNAYDKN